MLEIKNNNPAIYGYEDESEIDRLINEIELGNAAVLNQIIKEKLKKLLTD